MANEKLITLSNLAEFKIKCDGAYLGVKEVNTSTTLDDIGTGAHIVKLSSTYYVCDIEYIGGTTNVTFEIESLHGPDRWISTTGIAKTTPFVGTITSTYQQNYVTSATVLYKHSFYLAGVTIIAVSTSSTPWTTGASMNASYVNDEVLLTQVKIEPTGGVHYRCTASMIDNNPTSDDMTIYYIGSGGNISSQTISASDSISDTVTTL